jgi:hypothetical protein
VADAVRRNQSPDISKLAAAENSLASANLSGKSPDFELLANSGGTQASELSSEFGPSGGKFPKHWTGNNREVREILLVNTLLGCMQR